MLTTAQNLLDNDSRLRIEVVSKIDDPQRTCYVAMHQDYSENFSLDDAVSHENEEAWYGEKVVQYCLKGGHFGVIEHPQIVLNIGGFPHDVMQQLRTHRVGVSFDVQSGRYTSKRFLSDSPIEDVYWLRPIGWYLDRDDTPIYHYTEEWRDGDKQFLALARRRYQRSIEMGLAPEHARQLAPFGFRQDFVLSCNLRSALHLLMLRDKKDVQLETQAFALLLRRELLKWCPEITNWWESRGKKLKLTP